MILIFQDQSPQHRYLKSLYFSVHRRLETTQHLVDQRQKWTQFIRDYMTQVKSISYGEYIKNTQ